MKDIFTHLKWKKNPDYILGNINNPCNIGRVRKKFAKEAILWLLSKTSHSAREIADHFAISPQLVQYLITELTKDKRVVKLADSERYQARTVE